MFSIQLLSRIIKHCKGCELHELCYNQEKIQKGYGKLIGWGNNLEKCKFVFVGINPSHKRFPELQYIFGGEKGEKGHSEKFMTILEEIGLLEKIYFTNLVKCSTEDNKINNFHKEKCFLYLSEEISEISPVKIIALGNEVFDFLKKKMNKDNIVKVPHPSYVFRYGKITIEQYKEMILKACEE